MSFIRLAALFVISILGGYGLYQWQINRGSAQLKAGFALAEKTKRQEEALPAADNATVYATQGGQNESFITKGELDDRLVQILQVQAKGYPLENIPLEARRKFLDDLVRMKVIYQWCEKEGITQTEKFKEKLALRLKIAEELLATEELVEKVKSEVVISDADAEKDYKANKEVYLKTPETIQLEALSFADRSDAVSFYDSIKKNIESFEEEAKKSKEGVYKKYGRVTRDKGRRTMYDAQAPELLIEKAFALQKLPAVDLVEKEGKFWVLCAHDKQEKTYWDFDEIKEQIKVFLQQNIFNQKFERKIDELIKQANVQIVERHFMSELPGLEQEQEVDEQDILEDTIDGLR